MLTKIKNTEARMGKKTFDALAMGDRSAGDVMPTRGGGSPHTPTITIAEKAAEVIAADNR